jgi:hypothetical protein
MPPLDVLLHIFFPYIKNNPKWLEEAAGTRPIDESLLLCAHLYLTRNLNTIPEKSMDERSLFAQARLMLRIESISLKPD